MRIRGERLGEVGREESEREEKRKPVDGENDAIVKDTGEEEKRRRALYQRACETTISEAFKGSLNHGSLKHDPDKARLSKRSLELG